MQLLLFFHANPGVMETADGLARRLGLNAEILEEGMRDHVRLGIITERAIGSKTIYVYNRAAERDLSNEIRRTIERRMTEGAS